MGSNGAKSIHARPSSAYMTDECIVEPGMDKIENPISDEEAWSVAQQPGMLPADATNEEFQSYGPGPPVARIAAYMSTRATPENESARYLTADHSCQQITRAPDDDRSAIFRDDTRVSETVNVAQYDEVHRSMEDLDGTTERMGTTDKDENQGAHGTDDMETTSNAIAVTDATREATHETISEVPTLRLTITEMTEHVTPRIEEMDDVASAFEKHARIAQQSRADTYRKATSVQSMNGSLRLNNMPHESTIMSVTNADGAQNDTDQTLHMNEQEKRPNKDTHPITVKSNTKAVVTRTDKHAQCKGNDWHGEINSVFSNPWQALRKEANANRNRDPGKGRLKRREKVAKDSETQTSIDFGNVKPQNNPVDTLGDIKDRTEMENDESADIPGTGDVSVRLRSPDVDGSRYHIEAGTLEMPSTSGRESAVQLRSDLDNGRSKQLLELMSKGLGNFTDQMAEVMITKIRPEYEVLARQVGEEVKENTMVELRDLRLKVSKARTTLDDLEKDKDVLKRELTNEREHLKKKIEKDKERRKKDTEDKNDRIKELASQREKLQHSMKEYERMYKRAEHKAKHEEHKRVKSDEQYQKHIADIKKQLDKVKGDLLVQKSLRRLTVIANERKAQSASDRLRLVSHHGAAHKPID